MKEKNEENLIENKNKDNDNNGQNQNEKSSDIDQINNIENLKYDLNQSQDSLISEESNDKLKKIFGKYSLGIESLIYANPPNKDDVFLVLIFTGTLNFVKRYIQNAKRKNTYVEDKDNKNDEDNDAIELKETKDEKEIKDDLINEDEEEISKNKIGRAHV